MSQDDDDILFGDYSPDNESVEMTAAPEPEAAEPDQEDIEQSGDDSDKLLQRIADLEERLAALEKYDPHRYPFHPVYLADSLGQEQTVDGGAIVPFTDGRAHPDSITATAGDVLMIEYPDMSGGAMQRVAFAGGGGSTGIITSPIEINDANELDGDDGGYDTSVVWNRTLNKGFIIHADIGVGYNDAGDEIERGQKAKLRFTSTGLLYDVVVEDVYVIDAPVVCDASSTGGF